MRVITGTARGKRLGQLSGTDTRPTTDRVKEGIFNIIQFDIEGRRVLDLFAGTGQMGIECLSRGAAHCTFVDHRREAVRLIRDNLRLTGLADRASVLQAEAPECLRRMRQTFHLIFLDPPYEGGLYEKAFHAIAEAQLLAAGGTIIAESRSDKNLPEISSA